MTYIEIFLQEFNIFLEEIQLNDQDVYRELYFKMKGDFDYFENIDYKEYITLRYNSLQIIDLIDTEFSICKCSKSEYCIICIDSHEKYPNINEKYGNHDNHEIYNEKYNIHYSSPCYCFCIKCDSKDNLKCTKCEKIFCKSCNNINVCDDCFSFTCSECETINCKKCDRTVCKGSCSLYCNLCKEYTCEICVIISNCSNCYQSVCKSCSIFCYECEDIFCIGCKDLFCNNSKCNADTICWMCQPLVVCLNCDEYCLCKECVKVCSVCKKNNCPNCFEKDICNQCKMEVMKNNSTSLDVFPNEIFNLIEVLITT